MPALFVGNIVQVIVARNAAGAAILADVEWTQRNMLIFAVSTGLGFGIQLRPDAIGLLPASIDVLVASGIFPAAFLAIALDLLLPKKPAE